MSQYINFFIKHNNDFAPIAEFSRNSEIFQSFLDFAPWEKVSHLSNRDLSFIYREIKDKIDEYKKDINKKREMIDKVCSFTNSVEDKLDYIESYTSTIEALKDILNELYYAKHFISFLSEIEEYEKTKVYAGFEIFEPKPEDVIGE